MKNLGLTLLVFLFIGVGSSMAQDKKAADADAAVVKTEAATAKKACTGAEKKACCAKANAGKKDCSHATASADGKKGCAPGCEKACCMADAKATTKDSHEGHNHDHDHDHDHKH